MSVHHYGKVAFGSTTSTIFINGLKGKQQFANPAPGKDQVASGIAQWGSNNLLPQEMATDIEKTNVLTAGIEAKTRIALGKGVYPARITGMDENGYEQLEFVSDREILDWLEMTNSFGFGYATMRDFFAMGNAFPQLLLTPDRKKVMAVKRSDPTQCRLQEIDEKTGRIENVYLSGDWNQYADVANAATNPHMDIVPLLDREFPLYDLMSRTKGHRFAMCLQLPLTGRNYYAQAPWYSAYKWVKILQGIPEMKAAMFNNQMHLKYIIEVHEDFWPLHDPKYSTADEAGQLKIETEWYDQAEQYLVGGENAFKSMFLPKKANPTTGEPMSLVTITVLDDKMKDGKLLPDSAAGNIEVLLALMINACLLGVDMPGGDAYGGGAGSGSNIREAYLVQVMLLEFERKLLNRVFDLVKRYNGWPDDIVLRYPNQILTTLNTGANTQPTS